jgi:tetratricopeptide (TPR) repeat protein
LRKTANGEAKLEEVEWAELNDKATTLYQQGQFSKAIRAGKEALKVAKNTFGSDHANVATTMNNLALLYSGQGKYAEVEPLYERALKIRENTLGSGHPSVAVVLENMAELYIEIGKKE